MIFRKKSELEILRDNYNKSFPSYPPLMCYKNRWLYGMWLLGNNYKGSGYYGAYPPQYLKRIFSIFQDYKHSDILHLFSGSLGEDIKGMKFDIVNNFEGEVTESLVLGEAKKLSSYFNEDQFSLILADPPYSSEDAYHYGTPLINRNIVLKECYKILRPNGYVVWLDQVLPMYSKKLFNLVGTIGIVRSTNHRVRTVFIFKKV